MAVEKERGCGFRQVGGLYLVGGEQNAPCGAFPVELTVCPCCNQGVKPTRGFTWMDPVRILGGADERCDMATRAPELARICATCPMHNPIEFCNPENTIDADGKEVPNGQAGKCGLLWIGGAYYKTPEHFTREAAADGISRRISTVPKDFVIGESWVMLAHREAIAVVKFSDDDNTEDDVPFKPGIFAMFRPTHIEKIVTESEFADDEAMEKLRRRGITPVPVPDDDPDHNRKAAKGRQGALV